MTIAKRTENMANKLLSESFHVVSVKMREKHGGTGAEIITQEQRVRNTRTWILSLRNRLPFLDPDLFLGAG